MSYKSPLPPVIAQLLADLPGRANGVRVFPAGSKELTDKIVGELSELAETNPKGFKAVAQHLPAAANYGIPSEKLVTVAHTLAQEPHGELAFALSEQNAQAVSDYLTKQGVLGGPAGQELD